MAQGLESPAMWRMRTESGQVGEQRFEGVRHSSTPFLFKIPSHLEPALTLLLRARERSTQRVHLTWQDKDLPFARRVSSCPTHSTMLACARSSQPGAHAPIRPAA